MRHKKKDEGIEYIQQKIEKDEATCFRQDDNGVLWFNQRLVVPKDMELRKKIMDEAHLSKVLVDTHEA